MANPIPIPPSACPSCDAKIDAAKSVNDEDDMPSPGDLTMCAYCGTLLVFTPDMAMREATPELLAKLPDEQRTEILAMHAFFKNKIDPNYRLRKQIEREIAGETS